MNNQEVAHVWAQQTKTSGNGSNFFFEGETLYSYGKHFVVGRILRTGVAVLATRGYSPTTQRHQAYARRAVSHRSTVWCHDPADSAWSNMRAARDAIAQVLADMQKPRIRETTRNALALQAERLALQANEYLAAVIAIGEGEGSEPIAVHNLRGMADQIAAAKVAEKQLRAERERLRAAGLAETLADWRAGAVLQATCLYDLPPALRLGYVDASKFGPGSQIVETSHGASIPVADAEKLWPIILRVKGGAKDYTPGEPLGNYRLTQIRADGSIRVGCHDIAFSELESIAFQLGYITEGV